MAAWAYVSELDGSPVIVDVGAYHGVYAVMLGKLAEARGGKVVAIEPCPTNFRVLERNVALNGLDDTVICKQVGVLDYAGDAHFEEEGTSSHVAGRDTGTQVPVTTLADILTELSLQTVDVLMIDVEGAELLVLRGFPWGRVSVGAIFCELHPYAWRDFGYAAEDLSRFLDEHGYVCQDMYLKRYAKFPDGPDASNYIGPTILLSADGLR